MPQHIWIINEYAGSPYYGMEFRHYYLARELIKLGYKVTIISATYSHLFNNYPNPGKEIIDGIDYLWLKTLNYGNAHSKKRVLKWFIFSFKLFFLPFRLSKPDVIIVSPMATTPVYPAWLLSKYYKAKFVFEVKDIWPQTLVEIGGYSPKHPFIRFLKKLEIFALKKADYIISNLFNYQQYLDENKINRQFYWISNGIDLEELQDIEPLNNDIRNKIPNDKFIIGYTGTIGAANAIDVFLEASKYIDNDDIIFVIVGDGQEKSKLINNYKNDKIIFLDSMPKKQIQSLLQLFDVCYIGWRNINIYKYGISANKIFDYMYSGKPILHSFNGENDLIKIANCGITVPAEDPKAIAQGIIELYNMSSEMRKKLGDNGKNYVINNFSYQKLANDLVNIISK
ncbi:MAG: glycosyltransferase family 4 protein [Bacteroidales bacterium]|nr:glycosyltransferase family 4 protein [Bacteroidales bacterium]